MKFLYILLSISCFSFTFSQADSTFITTDVKTIVYSMDFPAAKQNVLDFILQNSIRIQNQTENKTELDIKFYLTVDEYKKWNELLPKLGYISSKTASSVSNLVRVNDINLEINYLTQKNKSYSEILSKIDEKSPSYLTLWNEQKILEEKIFNLQRELIYLNKKENKFNISLELNQEITSPEETGVSFINMPGIEYSYLTISEPKKGLSAANYQGYFVKYMFTKGKSYANLGIYKNSNSTTSDSSAYSEMFLLAFGQDFYSRHMGRGKRNFLNLYSGYTTGGILASSAFTNKTMFYIAPSIGLEIYKNKYMIIDTKVNYFLPLTDVNRNLKGISYNTSINFVF